MQTLLSVNNYFYRRDGSEVVYLEHNRWLNQEGWQVVPFAMHHPDNNASDWQDYFVDEIEFGADYSLKEKARRALKVVYSREAQKKLTSLIKKVRPDIAHCHTIYHHLSPAILTTLKEHEIPTAMTLHDLKVVCPAYHMYQQDRICEECKSGGIRRVVSNRCVKDSLLYSSLAYVEAKLHNTLGSYSKNVDVFISPCQFYIDKLVEWGWPAEMFQHVPNSIDADCFVPAEDNGGNYFLYFGRLSPEKGLQTLIEAAAIADVPIAFAGDGPDRQSLQSKARELNVQASFFGQLTPAALGDAVKGSKATVLPSQWYENAPMSVLESYGWGRPVIGARIGGIPEQLVDGETGYLFEAGSIAELARVLRQMADLDAEQLSRMRAAARNMVETRFSKARYLQRIRQLYTGLAAPTAHPGAAVK